MRFHGSARYRLVVLVLLLGLADVGLVLAQENTSTSQRRDTVDRPGIRTISIGQKAKLKGSIVRRDADTFSIRDDQDIETVVLLTEETSVKSKGGFLRFGKNYDVTSLLRGLPVEVEGVGNREGQLVASKVRFESSDLKVARLVEKRVAPVEEANERLAGQVDEVGEVSKLARAEAGRAHERISSLDDYNVQDSASVYFKVNSAIISPEGRLALNDLAQKASNTKGYVIEITGHADATGNAQRNRTLSQQRADAVVRYLQENHEIPLRRMITPFGYGQLRPVADNSTAEGRRQNRRVEVKILVSKGMAGSGQ
ncbi:MAG TPA: OmpA family protein [Blastocatellia bacterium]|nr:OmpA family protein [Blastocatellia bacterium]